MTIGRVRPCRDIIANAQGIIDGGPERFSADLAAQKFLDLDMWPNEHFDVVIEPSKSAALLSVIRRGDGELIVRGTPAQITALARLLEKRG